MYMFNNINKIYILQTKETCIYKHDWFDAGSKLSAFLIGQHNISAYSNG